jgi:hypothetical protein
MAATCWSSVRGRALRVTRLDACCNPPAAGTACAMVVSDGFVSVAYAKNIAEGTDIEVRKADGTLCVTDQSCPEMKWIDLTITLCQVDPDLLQIMTGAPLAVNYLGTKVGVGDVEDIPCVNFALEVWTDIPTQVCLPGSVKQYGYFLTPCVTNGIVAGDLTIENDAASFTVTARTKAGSAWGTGPAGYDVDGADAANTPGPLLTPIGVREHRRMQLVTIPPPVAVCGCQVMP